MPSRDFAGGYFAVDAAWRFSRYYAALRFIAPPGAARCGVEFSPPALPLYYPHSKISITSAHGASPMASLMPRRDLFIYRRRLRLSMPGGRHAARPALLSSQRRSPPGDYPLAIRRAAAEAIA